MCPDIVLRLQITFSNVRRNVPDKCQKIFAMLTICKNFTFNFKLNNKIFLHGSYREHPVSITKYFMRI